MTMHRHKRGQRVLVEGYDDVFVVVSYFYEFSDDQDGEWECAFYNLRSEKTGLLLDYVDATETNISSVEEQKKLQDCEVDSLLDQYNAYISINTLLNSIGIEDSEYADKAKVIVESLRDH